MPELIYDRKELKKIKNFERDLRWFKLNYDEIKSGYKGQHVAIEDEKIIDSDRDPIILFKRLEKKYEDLSSLVVEYISEHKAEYVL
jgi:uncharacterized protein DUF5678